MDITQVLPAILTMLGEPDGRASLPLTTVFGIAFLFVLVQGFFAGYETGVVSANPIRLSHLVEAGSRNAKAYCRLVHRRDRVLTLTLVGTNVAVVCATILVAGRIGKLWTTLLLTPVSLIFGEIIAKTVFRRHATRFVIALAYPMRVLYITLLPVVAVASAFSNSLLRLFTGKSRRDASPLTREELRYVFLEGEDSAAIETTEREMIHGVIDLSTTMAKEVMVPRTRMVAVESRATQGELIKRFQESGYSRMPVYRERVDNVIGVVNVFDIIREGVDTPGESIKRFIRPAYYVPDTKRVGELLQELRANRIHMAIVIDEYGGTDGIVTLEDAIEEIFGEIQDEYDEEPPAVDRIGQDSLLVDADLDIEEASKALGIELPTEDAETVGGFVLNLAGKIPAAGEIVVYRNATFTVVEADEHSISKLKVDIKQGEQHGT